MRSRYASRATSYKGVKMRSRLEATAAAHLDDLGIEWAYEPRCFADGFDQYLPDFQLWPSGHPQSNGAGWWLEIKPSFMDEWPEWSGTDLESAVAKMLVIRSSEPRAVLSLWTPNTERPAAGKLMVHSPAWGERETFNRVPALDYLARSGFAAHPSTLYAHRRSRREVARRLVDDRRADPWGEIQ